MIAFIIRLSFYLFAFSSVNFAMQSDMEEDVVLLCVKPRDDLPPKRYKHYTRPRGKVSFNHELQMPFYTMGLTDLVKAGRYLYEASNLGPEQKGAEENIFLEHGEEKSFQYAALVTENSIETLPGDPEFFQRYRLSDDGKILNVDLQFGQGHKRIRQTLKRVPSDEDKFVYETTEGPKFRMTFAKDGEDGLRGYATMGQKEIPHGEFRLIYITTMRQKLQDVCSVIADCFRDLCPKKLKED